MSQFKVSNCCGAYPVWEAEEMGICIDCLEHCEYVDDEEEEEAASVQLSLFPQK